MRKPRAGAVSHACRMPRARRRYHNRLFICDCGCGWRTIPIAGYETIDWAWEQVI